MKKLLRLLTISGFLMAVSTSQALAQSALVYSNGSGCPDNSVSATFSPDGQALSILFDKYIADARFRNTASKKCNLTISMFVPRGYQFFLYSVDYRGFVSPKTIGILRTEYFFEPTRNNTTQRSKVFQNVLIGETNYTKRNSLVVAENDWSQCGVGMNMRVNTSLYATGKGIATLDSIDGTRSTLNYYIIYRRCG
jgi:hypothetical protein